ncbi:MAG TPA: hypothetical protein VMG08_02680 [Allosphingosinicella sp.]|nr:hypothetical protein [Allosphingosinicella sp.]
MSRSDLAGMTVNERLFNMGLLDEWDDAARSRDRARMIEIMRQIAVHPSERTADMVLADPAMYGF